MMNRFDLEQLKRDANKSGAWQAKLAYTMYIIKYRFHERNLAEPYLKELIAAKVGKYSLDAQYFYERYFQPDNQIIRHALTKKALENKDKLGTLSQHYSNSHLDSPENIYKISRYEYENNIKNRDEFKNTLENLLSLNSIEMTDTLRAKIYFQLIRVHIEDAKEKGQRQSLEQAKKYCLLLIKDPMLSGMKKAKEGARIYDRIKTITDKPIHSFSEHVSNFFNTGKEISRMTFKYMGIALGNIPDFVLLGMPKLIGKHVNAQSGHYVREGKTTSQELFKNNGFAAGFKFLGKLFGKHIIGNLVTGPIAGLVGLMTYPFSYIYNRYKSNDQLKKIADEVIQLDKENIQPLSSQGNMTKKMFSHKKDNHDYGHQVSNEEVNQAENVKSSSISIVPTYLSRKGTHAYGRIFACKPENVVTENPVTPIYPVVSYSA